MSYCSGPIGSGCISTVSETTAAAGARVTTLMRKGLGGSLGIWRQVRLPSLVMVIRCSLKASLREESFPGIVARTLEMSSSVCW